LAQRDVVFRFAELPEQRAAYTQKVADWAALVSFSTLKRWDITTFQRWLNSDTNLETFVLHEMGHVVGLRHTQNTRSIMAAHPPLTKELHSSDAAVWRSYIRKLDGQARTTQGLIA
jgi:predicted Zn-dependent protease